MSERKGPSPITLDDGYAIVYLSDGSQAIINEGDIPVVGMYRWHLRKNSNGLTSYAIANAKASCRSRSVFMHRVILATDTALQVDHINGNGLDNRRSNLRAATPSQNRQNAKKHRFSGVPSSEFIGVQKYTVRGAPRWRVEVRANKELFRLNNIRDEIEAAKIRDRFAVAFHGEFARLNFPELRAEYAAQGLPGPRKSKGLPKLTTADVRLIRIGLAHGQSQRFLARQFGVSQRAIFGVAKFETWRDVS